MVVKTHFTPKMVVFRKLIFLNLRCFVLCANLDNLPNLVRILTNFLKRSYQVESKCSRIAFMAPYNTLVFILYRLMVLQWVIHNASVQYGPLQILVNIQSSLIHFTIPRLTWACSLLLTLGMGL
jgi:hypothetical protein